jgi:hypothetical protein
MAAENGGYCPRQVLRIEYPLLKSVPIENVNQAARPLRLDSTCERDGILRDAGRSGRGTIKACIQGQKSDEDDQRLKITVLTQL